MPSRLPFWSRHLLSAWRVCKTLRYLPRSRQSSRSGALGPYREARRDALLLSLPAVQEELKLTDEQKKEHEAIRPRFIQKRQQARRNAKDMVKFRELIMALVKEGKRHNWRSSSRSSASGWTRSSSRPRARSHSWDRTRAPRPTSDLHAPERLKITDEQVRRAREIAKEGQKEIANAATFPIVLGSQGRPAEHGSCRQAGRDARIPGREAEGRKGRPRGTWTR